MRLNAEKEERERESVRTQIRTIEENQRKELWTGVNAKSKSTEQRRIRYRFSLGVHIHPYSLCLADFSAFYFVCRYACVRMHCVWVFCFYIFVAMCTIFFCAFHFAHLVLSLLKILLVRLPIFQLQQTLSSPHIRTVLHASCLLQNPKIHVIWCWWRGGNETHWDFDVATVWKPIIIIISFCPFSFI